MASTSYCFKIRRLLSSIIEESGYEPIDEFDSINKGLFRIEQPNVFGTLGTLYCELGETSCILSFTWKGITVRSVKVLYTSPEDWNKFVNIVKQTIGKLPIVVVEQHTDFDLKTIANILQETMTSAGIFDDIDELIADRIEYNVLPHTISWARDVDECILFINEQLDTTYEPFASEELQSQLESQEE